MSMMAGPRGAQKVVEVDGTRERRSDGASIVVDRSGVGPFITHLILEEPSGQHLLWGSRRNRKGLDPEPVDLVGRSRPRSALPIYLDSLTWWVAVLFMVGSALFAVGSASVLVGASLVAKSGRIFFVGSIFFTSAAYFQFLEVVNEPDALTKKRPPASLWRWEPHKIAWWSCTIQLFGTLSFNMSTFEAMRSLNPTDQDRFVWTPDAIGSICFLIASYLAWAEVCRRWFSWQPRNISWWVVLIGLCGSLAFGVSAVASIVIVGTGDLLDAHEANLWTLLGAICFFLQAYLLLPEMTAKSQPQSP